MGASRQSEFLAAIEHLRKADRVLRPVIEQVGPCTLRPQRDRFRMLVRSIISQQISTAAANSIRKRLDELIAPQALSAEVLAALSLDELRQAGVSPQKGTYLRDLSQRVLDGSVQLATIGRCDDEGVIERLTRVKGIGRWTAQMFLIFSLGRLDVFPHDDLGVRTALREMYGLADLPRKDESCRIAEPWRPYASIASWYCWRFLDLRKNIRATP